MRPGQSVRGKILIDVKHPVQGGTVRVSILGEEEVRYTRESSSTEDRMSSKRLYLDKEVIAHVAVSLEGMNQRRLEKGNYSLDFSIDLPERIPATMKFGNYDDGCSIQYKIIASLGRLESEWPLIVRSIPLPNVQSQFFMEPKVERVSTMGFGRDGRVIIGARVDRRKVDRGQLLYVSVACLNTTSIEIRSVSIRAMELITMYSRKLNWTIIRKVALVDMRVVELSGLITSNARADKQGSPAAERASDFRCIYDALEHGANAFPITLPTVSETRCIQ